MFAVSIRVNMVAKSEGEGSRTAELDVTADRIAQGILALFLFPTAVSVA